MGTSIPGDPMCFLYSTYMILAFGSIHIVLKAAIQMKLLVCIQSLLFAKTYMFKEL